MKILKNILFQPLWLLFGLFIIGVFTIVLTVPLWYTIPTPSLARAGVIDDNDKYAWGENIGWIDFKPAGLSAEQQIVVGDNIFSGYAWGENIGWINFGDGSPESGDQYANDSPVDFGVNNDDGALSGFAWGENVGWIDFDPEGDEQVVIVNGEFTGYAWGENIGWISFNCVNNDSCGEGGVDYKVATNFTPSSKQKDTESPGPVTNVQMLFAPEDNALTIGWLDPADSDLDVINVYRNNPPGEPLVSGTTYNRISGGVQGLVDTNIIVGETYRYIFRPVDFIGNISEDLTEYVIVPGEEPLAMEEEAPPVEEPIFPFDLQVGQVVRRVDASALYYLGRDGLTHVFLTPGIYQSWYGQDFSQVTDLPASQFDQLVVSPLPVQFKPGVFMVKQTAEAQTYVVDKQAKLKHVANEDVAVELYGANWNQQIYDIDDIFHLYQVVPEVVYGLEDFNPTVVSSLYPTPDDAMGL